MYLPGRIVAKRAASPTVTLLDLCVPQLQIRPGQWLDFRVPSHDWIGGYSLAKRIDSETVQIAVKQSSSDRHRGVEPAAPAQAWVTNESTVGNAVLVQPGGNAILHSNTTAPAVFIAGGIGISPLFSLFQQHVTEQRPPALFYYSITTEEEFVFGRELQELLRPIDELVVALTQQSTPWNSHGLATAGTNVHYKLGRQSLAHFLESLASPPPSSCSDRIYYVCGPPSLQDSVLDQLATQGVSSDHMVYEKWW